MLFRSYTSSGLTVADVWNQHDITHSWKSNCTVISFYPLTYLSSPGRSEHDVVSEVSFLTLSDNLVVNNISCVRNDYLIVLCEKCLREPSTTQWISGAVAISVIVHIPSRREIGRIAWNVDWISSNIIPSFASNGQGTLCMESRQTGIIMTGDDIRFHDQDGDTEDSRYLKADAQQMELSTRKKKKKAVRTKKDSFRTHNGNGCF